VKTTCSGASAAGRGDGLKRDSPPLVPIHTVPSGSWAKAFRLQSSQANPSLVS
jgi:hypothetical protein